MSWTVHGWGTPDASWDYGNRSAEICLLMQAVGQAGHSLSVNITISMEQIITKRVWLKSNMFKASFT